MFLEICIKLLRWSFKTYCCYNFFAFFEHFLSRKICDECSSICFYDNFNISSRKICHIWFQITEEGALAHTKKVSH